MRYLLAALIAIAMVGRFGAGCEAIAAVPSVAAVASSHCVDEPAKPGKRVKVEAATCALCGALPHATAPVMQATNFGPVAHAAYSAVRLISLARAPAPPPPKTV